jgi:hypothetical protein
VDRERADIDRAAGGRGDGREQTHEAENSAYEAQ